MIKQIDTLESAHFSTGNGGATFEIVRESYGGRTESFKLIHEISHYGLRQSATVPINDLAMMDEMIVMMQRARFAMVGVQTGQSTSRVYRKVIDGIPVAEPIAEPDDDYSEDMCDEDTSETDEEDSSIITTNPNVKVRLSGQKAPPDPDVV